MYGQGNFQSQLQFKQTSSSDGDFVQPVIFGLPSMVDDIPGR